MARQAEPAFDSSGKPQNYRTRLVDGMCRSGRVGLEGFEVDSEPNREIGLEWDSSHQGLKNRDLR
jgi:hypothetical protein